MSVLYYTIVIHYYYKNNKNATFMFIKFNIYINNKEINIY